MNAENHFSDGLKEITAGIIVIGDEVLKGRTQDTNSSFLALRLFDLGVRVKRISVISDDVDVIAKEVSEFSKTFTYVLTSGGIGPTHDDVTLEGVAKAFSEQLFSHPDLISMCNELCETDDILSPNLKMAFVPLSTELCYGIDKKTNKPGKFPIAKVRNVYVFPGVPQLLRNSFERLENVFHNPAAKFCTREIYVTVEEFSITKVLNDANAKFKERVTLGSYPELHNSYYKVKLCLDSTEGSMLDEMSTYLHDNLPAGSIVDYNSDPVDGADSAVYALMDASVSYLQRLSEKVRKAVSVVEESMKRFGLSEICIGFNGGKDCTVLLHLVHAVHLKHRTADHSRPQQRLIALYIIDGTVFPEMKEFVEKCRRTYNLEMIIVKGHIKEALKELKSLRPELKAVLMGSRLSDPYCTKLEDFSRTDAGWPEYMRINPLLSWTYENIWTFVRRLCLPYCSLYDQGFTSVGSIEDSKPNSALECVTSDGCINYQPAYMLTDDKLERDGRKLNS